MTGVDRSKKYLRKEEVFYGDGREIKLLQYIFHLPESRLSQIRGRPEEVLACMDEYAQTREFLMTIGPYKGQVIREIVEHRKPVCGVEFGVYVGYSAILIGSIIHSYAGDNGRYWCLEKNPLFAAVATALVELAGLSHTVKIVVGQADESLTRLHSSHQLSSVDLLLFDHLKPRYIVELHSAERMGLIKESTIMIADDATLPAAAPYLTYVRMNIPQKVALYEGQVACEELRAFNRNISKDLAKQPECLHDYEYEGVGDARLGYQSIAKHTFLPHGPPDDIEITICVEGRKDNFCVQPDAEEQRPDSSARS